MKKPNQPLHFFGLGLLILLVTFIFAQRGLFMGVQHSLQNKFYDLDSASGEIVIVSIDEKSLQENQLGPLNRWPRAYYAQAIEELNGAGAAVIGIDITFPDASYRGVEDDQVMTDALKAHSNVVLASRYYVDRGKIEVEWPNQTLLEANPQLSWINVQLDEDGFVRRIPVFRESERGVTEAFSLAIAREYMKAEKSDYRISQNLFPFSNDISIPVKILKDQRLDEETPLMYVNYFAQPNGFRQMSFVNVIQGEFVDKQNQIVDLTDKIVLIGPTAVDLQDDYLSPVSSGVKMPGVEIHANAIQTVIQKDFLRDQSALSLWFVLMGVLLMNLILFSFLKVRYAAIVLVFELIGILIAGIIVYEFQIFMNVVYPIFVALLSFVGAYVMRFILEQKRRQFIERAFGQYVNKTVVRQIQKHPEMLKLGGIKRELTLFFSDIEGFTTISENMQPTELVSFLNEYLNEMTEIILKNEGTLDKYEGDAMMSFWNAPLQQLKPAFNACAAALENQEKLASLRKKWAKEGKPQVRVRIGINTGEAVVGNMGSTNRFDYTAMGDNVNLASRLEGLNKYYGTQILISHSTFEQVKDHFICREIDRVRVKGKHEPVSIYELICKKEQKTTEISKLIETFKKALELYRQQSFEEAKTIFQKLKDDRPSEVFIKRCDKFIKEPPAKDWDGVWSFEVK